jgi:hypothetical protein
MCLPRGFAVPSLRDTLDVLRGALTGDAVTALLEAIRTIKLVDAPVATLALDPDGASCAPSTLPGFPEGLPEDLSDVNLFATLLHLLHPGTMASRRSAAVTAALVLASQAPALAGRARRLLNSLKGTWTGADDWETYPEVFSVQFMLLMRRVCDVLTSNEAVFFDRMWYIWRVQRTRTIPVAVRIAKQLSGSGRLKTTTMRDHRRSCGRCMRPRPVSLLVGGTCVLCLLGHADVPPPCETAGFSHVAQCRMASCRARYAVERPAQLRVEPKCHYCREKTAAPTLSCATCRGAFIVPDHAAEKEHWRGKPWKCAVCAEGGDNTEVVMVPLGELMEANPGLLAALDVSVPLPALTMKLSSVFKQHKDTIVEQEPAVDMQLEWSGEQVLNSAELCTATAEAVRSADIADLCAICYQVCALTAMTSACGACDTLVCAKCIASWYSFSPGQLPLSAARLACPFCKRRPTAFASLCGRRNVPRRIDEEAGMVLGFCAECRVIRGVMPLTCAHPEMLEIANWRCLDCREAERIEEEAQLEEERKAQLEEKRTALLMNKSKVCPGCSYTTIKSDGCNHIECAACHTHWCWQCGKKFAADTIYEHMTRAHGGWGI